MIKEIFYTDNRTYIKGETGKEIDTDRIPFTKAFKLATIANVEIHFENLTKTDTIDFSKYIEKKQIIQQIYTKPSMIYNKQSLNHLKKKPTH